MDQRTQEMIATYDWFQRGQTLEGLKIYGPAAEAYQKAGALKAATRMRERAGICLTSIVDRLAA